MLQRSLVSSSLSSHGTIRVCSPTKSNLRWKATGATFPVRRRPLYDHSFSRDASTFSKEQQRQRMEEMKIPQLLKHLKYAATWNHGVPGRIGDKRLWRPDSCRETFEWYNQILLEVVEQPKLLPSNLVETLLSPEVVGQAFKALSKSDYMPPAMSIKVRSLERFLGRMGQTQLTDELSLRLLAANSRAGNVGRSLQLLELRGSRSFPPRNREFVYAIQAIESANFQNKTSRNYFVGEAEQIPTDNPTRWLDAVLIQMASRNYALTTAMANRMLHTYAAGKTGKLVHHFYKVVRQPINSLPPDERPRYTDEMPKDWFHVPGNDPSIHGYKYQPLKVKIKHNKYSAPYYKVPAQAKGKLFSAATEAARIKIDLESEPDYSRTLAAAFAFCDSLEHGACGHKPLKLDTGTYNALIKACVHRGALWRAMNVLDTVMPNSNCVPNNISFNLILGGLAAVGDVTTTQEYFRRMMDAGLRPDPFTIRAIVDGLLNLGDVTAAVTVVQDFFNQHNVLPPYQTHLKVLEFCLGRDMAYEAKRYCYFLQQLWYWTPNDYHHPSFIRLMRATQRNTQLQKPALKKLFAYFGEELKDEDFIDQCTR